MLRGIDACKRGKRFSPLSVEILSFNHRFIFCKGLMYEKAEKEAAKLVSLRKKAESLPSISVSLKSMTTFIALCASSCLSTSCRKHMATMGTMIQMVMGVPLGRCTHRRIISVCLFMQTNVCLRSTCTVFFRI